MSFLDEIQKQPKRIREILFGLSVVTTLSLIGIVWVKSVKTDLYALLNPNAQVEEQRYLAEDEQPSLFGTIFKSAGNLKAQIFGSINTGPDETAVTPAPAAKARALPLPEDKK